MTQEKTMALGADFIDNVFGGSRDSLEHHGVKGMKWGTRNATDSIPVNARLTKDTQNGIVVSKSSGGDGGGGGGGDGGKDIAAPKDSNTSETPAERARRFKVADEFLKSKGKADAKKTGKGGGAAKKGGGKGGAKKKGGAAGKKKPAKKSGSGSSSRSGSSSTSVSSLMSTLAPKHTFASRKSISSVLAAMPKSNVRQIPENPRAKAIIAEINAKVAARKAASTVVHSDLTSNNSFDTLNDMLAHFGTMGMKWGVRNDQAPAPVMPAMGGGGQTDEEKLIAELTAKGLTMDEIMKQIQDTFGGIGKTIDDIKSKIQENIDHPNETQVERAQRHNREYRAQEDADWAKQKADQKAEDDRNGGRILYDVFGFPTSPDDPSGMPAPRHKNVTHSEGGDMTDTKLELIAVDSMDKILAHHGILGMKWGIRNDTRSSGRPQGGTSKKKAPLSSVKKMIGGKKVSDATVTADSKPNSDSGNQSTDSQSTSQELAVKTEAKKTSTDGGMSDEDLRNAINRLQMEKTYKQLMAERNPVVAKKADNIIKKLLTESTKAAAGQILTSTFKTVGTYAIAAGMAKAGNPSLATAMLAKNEGNWAPKKPDTTSQNESKPKTTTSISDMTPSDAVKEILDEMERRRNKSTTP